MKNGLVACACLLCLLAPMYASGEEPHKVIACPTGPGNPRNGEGDIIELKDGRLFLAYSRFTAGKSNDDAPAEIHGIYSRDGGLTWADDVTLIKNDAMNLMSVSLLRLRPSGDILMVYGRRHSNAKMLWYARRSSDDGNTWGDDALVTPEPMPAYHVINNARIIQLKSGRLLAPEELCRGETWKKDFFFFGSCCHSDDNGRTWHAIPQRLTVPGCSFGANEPGVVELKDGRILMMIRTDVGTIWRSFSSDGGLTWSAPEATDFASPASPATVTRIPSTGDLLLVWNNASPTKKNKGEPRNPLTTAVSSDEGKTWRHVRNLEDTPGADYCYVSVTFVGERAVMSYYERAALKVAVVPVKWFYRE